MTMLRGIGWDHRRAMGPLFASVPIYRSRFGVDVEWSARSLKEFADASIVDLAKQYDLIVLDHPHIGVTQTEANPLIPLDDYLLPTDIERLRGQSIGPSHDSYNLGGHQWGLAIDAAMQTSVRRDDLLTEDVPRTWGEVMALASAFEGERSRVAMPLAECDCICSYLSIVKGFGGYRATQDRLANEAVGLRALAILQHMADQAHPLSLDCNPIQMLDHMSEHDDIAYCPLLFCYINYTDPRFRTYPLSYGPIPQDGGSILGGAGISVSAFSSEIEKACRYAGWLCGSEVQRGFYLEHGGQPGNREAWHTDQASPDARDFFDSTRHVIENSFVRPRHPGWPEFQEHAGMLIRNTLINHTDHGQCYRDLEMAFRGSLVHSLRGRV